MNICKVMNSSITIAKDWYIGQKLQVEVISKEKNGNGIISIAGKYIPAKLEIDAGVGEKIWTVIKQINSDGITLAMITNPLIKEFSHQVLETKGLPKDKFLLNILQDYARGELNLKILVEQNVILKSQIPHWETINFTSILTFLSNLTKKLGIDYERQIYQLFTQQINESDYKDKLKDLRNSIKGGLLQYIDQEKEGKLTLASQELKTILAQQLWWLKDLSSDHTFFLFNLPLFKGEILKEARIAIESAKKGNKVNISYCHVGIELETENLGVVGADVMFYENKIYITILGDSLKNINIFELFYDKLKNEFENIGLKLMSLRQGEYGKNTVFYEFMRGERCKGVDLRG